ncbi:MAG TPA: SOS response-associated peptidase [Beijerinckiaceae bacterium]|jgi:putative SOS response-associated peptidase YedK
MCGRYAITLAPEVFRQTFGYPEQPNFPPRYNVAPTQPVPIVTAEHGNRHFRLVRWGFLPSWVKDPKAFPLIINARSETLLEKPTFRAAVTRRRCLFLADGFYEWRRLGRAKAPYLIRRKDGAPLFFAGLWETYSDPAGGEIDTAAIVTTDANGVLAAIHDRMPAILAVEDVAPWLSAEEVPPKDAVRLVRPCPEDWIEAVPVSRRVNSVANDDPGLQEVLAREDTGPEASGSAAVKPSRSKAAKSLSSDEDEQGRLI